ncbi:MAG: zf-HC2 domain-containing protein [Candidatus Eremiobacteraeota bacterium]|nr:zf-HC2 domain-containing protein [Candidatus Eremiobacteraeota bacterium]
MNQTHPSIEAIVDFLHGEMPAPQLAAIAAHLAGCPECQDRRAAEDAITDAVRAYAREQERALPANVVAGIRRGIEPGGAPWGWEGFRAVLRPIYAVPLAAAIALVLYIGISARHGENVPPAIDSAYYVENHAVMAETAPFADGAPPAIMLTSSR